MRIAATLRSFAALLLLSGLAHANEFPVKVGGGSGVVELERSHRVVLMTGETKELFVEEVDRNGIVTGEGCVVSNLDWSDIRSINPIGTREEVWTMDDEAGFLLGGGRMVALRTRAVSESCTFGFSLSAMRERSAPRAPSTALFRVRSLNPALGPALPGGDRVLLAGKSLREIPIDNGADLPIGTLRALVVEGGTIRIGEQRCELSSGSRAAIDAFLQKGAGFLSAKIVRPRAPEQDWSTPSSRGLEFSTVTEPAE